MKVGYKILQITRLLPIATSFYFLFKLDYTGVMFCWMIYGLLWSMPEFFGLTKEIWTYNKSSASKESLK